MSAEGNVSVVDSTILWFVESLPSFSALALFSDFGCATLPLVDWDSALLFTSAFCFESFTDALSLLSADDAASVLAVVGAVAVDPVGAFSFVAVVVLLLFVVLSAGVALSVSVTGLSVVPLLVDSTSGLLVTSLSIVGLFVDASTLELLLACGLSFASSVADVAVVSPVAASLLFGVVGEASALPLSVVSDTLGCPVFSGVALAFEFAVASLLSIPLLVSLASGSFWGTIASIAGIVTFCNSATSAFVCVLSNLSANLSKYLPKSVRAISFADASASAFLIISICLLTTSLIASKAFFLTSGLIRCALSCSSALFLTVAISAFVVWSEISSVAFDKMSSKAFVNASFSSVVASASTFTPASIWSSAVSNSSIAFCFSVESIWMLSNASSPWAFAFSTSAVVVASVIPCLAWSVICLIIANASVFSSAVNWSLWSIDSFVSSALTSIAWFALGLTVASTWIASIAALPCVNASSTSPLSTPLLMFSNAVWTFWSTCLIACCFSSCVALVSAEILFFFWSA